ncbi:hypothetical protein VFPBJ_11529 [Purpureocillium lilacinum]|uniref:Uncharacterized protein n=1 Tax=Purpureocillium lilacinum TaxID=33203 RepID=A0A179F6U4_PURLI|nr:hypothetical protein VFPBJ_11529 [Purpureocillium lilacinum]
MGAKLPEGLSLKGQNGALSAQSNVKAVHLKPNDAFLPWPCSLIPRNDSPALRSFPQGAQHPILGTWSSVGHCETARLRCYALTPVHQSNSSVALKASQTHRSRRPFTVPLFFYGGNNFTQLCFPFLLPLQIESSFGQQPCRVFIPRHPIQTCLPGRKTSFPSWSTCIVSSLPSPGSTVCTKEEMLDCLCGTCRAYTFLFVAVSASWTTWSSERRRWPACAAPEALCQYVANTVLTGWVFFAVGRAAGSETNSTVPRLLYLSLRITETLATAGHLQFEERKSSEPAAVISSLHWSGSGNQTENQQHSLSSAPSATLSSSLSSR